MNSLTLTSGKGILLPRAEASSEQATRHTRYFYFVKKRKINTWLV